MGTRIKSFAVIIFLVFINLACFAQVSNPCGGSGDPDDPTTCPLDSWVMILVAAALIFVTLRLYKQQKAQNAIVKL